MQKIVNSLPNVSNFFFSEKMKVFPEKNQNIISSKGRKQCGKRKKCLYGKGFQCTEFANHRTSDNAQDRQSELNLILGKGKHTG